MKFLAALFFAILLFWMSATACAQQPDFSDIKNFFRVDEHYCTGGQPTMEDLARMKAAGTRAVLNLRQPGEFNAAEEKAKAKELGLRYFLIPVKTAAPKDAQVAKFLKLLADPQNRPAFIHCHTANRVGAFWMIRRVLVDGWKIEDAEQEAEKMGMHTESLRDFALGYIRRHQKIEKGK